MIDLIFLVIFFLFPLLVFRYMSAIGHSITDISMPTITIISMFVYAYAGILPLYFGWDEYRYNAGVQDKYLVIQILVFSIISIVGLLIGFSFSKFFLKMNSFQGKLSLRQPSQKETASFVFMVILCFSFLFIYLSKIPSVALLVALDGGNASAVALSRSMMGNDFPGKYHWYSLFMHHVFTLITFTLFCSFLLTKKRIFLFFFLVSFLGSSFAALMATEKKPFAEILIGLLFVYGLTATKGKIPVKALVLFLILLFFSLIAFYICFMGSRDVTSALFSIFSRALAGSIEPAYYYLEMFPENQEFLIGRSFPNPMGFMPFEPYRLTVEVMKWVHPNNLGIVGSMPTVFWAEAYANFGCIGVFIIPIIVGSVLYGVYYFINKLENTPFKVGLVVYCILHYKNVSISGFSGFLIDIYIVFPVFLVLLLIALSNNLKVTLSKERVIF